MVCFIKRANRRGFALIAVLWLVVLLTVLAMGLSYSSRTMTKSAGVLVESTRNRYLAEGAIQLVLGNLLERQATRRLLADGEALDVELADALIEVVVSDEAGKVDLNAARPELLVRLLYSLDVEQSQAEGLADAIADYRDSDELTRLKGAEDDDYLLAGLPWESKDAAFTSLDELRQVYGMSEDIFLRMLPFVTLHSKQQGVNPEVAPLAILQAIADDSTMALEEYVELRRRNHREGLPLPSAPKVAREFVARSRGVVYNLRARVASEVSGVVEATVRLRRSRSRMSIEMLDWRPYAESTFAIYTERDTLAGENK